MEATRLPIKDHGALDGLADDDHARYFDKDGSKAATGNIDFAKFKAIQMVCDNGTSFPASPATAQWFYRTDIKTLLIYEGAWKTIVSFGAVTLYVDGSSGTDAVGQGYSAGAGAVATIQYAISLVPSVNGGSVIINVTAGNYAENVTVQGKGFVGPYSLSIVGEMTTLEANTTANIFSAATIGNSGMSMTVNAYARKRLRIVSGTGSGQIVIIDSNTATTLTIAGGGWGFSKASGLGSGNGVTPDATSVFVIEDWATNITSSTNIVVSTGQSAVWFKDIKITGTVYIMPASQAYLFGCWVYTSSPSGGLSNRSIYIEQGNGFIFSTLVSDTSGGFAAIQALDASSAFVGNCYIYNINGSGIRATTGTATKVGSCLIDTCTMNGAYPERNSVITFLTSGLIRNCAGWGIFPADGGVYFASPIPSFASNTLGDYPPYDKSLVSVAGAKRTPFHFVEGSVALVAGTAVVTLTAPAVFTSATTYTVNLSRTVATGWGVVNNSGSQFTITSANLLDTDTVRFQILGS